MMEKYSFNFSKPLEGKIKLNIDGNSVYISTEEFSELVKEKLMSSPSVQKVCQDFEMEADRIKNLRVEIHDLNDNYAETDGNVMKINKLLLEDGNFFDTKFFIVVHEIVHFLSRQKEEDAYFNDPEEVLGFVLSIAYELEQGSDVDVIWNRIYPKVSFHFDDESDARDFFENMLYKAMKLLRS